MLSRSDGAKRPIMPKSTTPTTPFGRTHMLPGVRVAVKKAEVEHLLVNEIGEALRQLYGIDLVPPQRGRGR